MKTLIASILLAFSYAAHAVPALNSAHAVVLDADTQEVLLEKNADTPAPMASITKVLTAMVALDAKPDLSETLRVTDSDVDRVKNSSSRVRVGTEMSRQDMLHIALMSSENRAASALSYNYPGGHDAFIAAMNKKAKSLGMNSTSVQDSTGLSPENHATARDLSRMVLAADDYAPITQFTSMSGYELPVGPKVLKYRNSNPLVGKPNWDIELSKTGYTKEAGRCIVMKMAAAGKKLVVVLMGSQSSGARMADIQAIKRWVTGEPGHELAVARKETGKHQLAIARAERKEAKTGLRLASRKSSGYQHASFNAKKPVKAKAKALRLARAEGKKTKAVSLARLDSKKQKGKYASL